MAVNVEFGACPFERIVTFKKTYDEPFEDTSQVKQKREEIVSGRLYFGPHGSDVKHMPFILAEHDTSVEDILSMLVDEWRAPLPKILLFVISPSKEYSSENHRKIQNLLVKGLITALNTTEMWLCTNGVYSGFCKDLSLALANELSRRRILLESMHTMSVSSFPETAVIGINPLENLNFTDKLDPTGNLSNTSAFDTAIGKHTISKYFNYFLFVKDHNKRYKGVQNFVLRFANCLREKLRFERKGEMDSDLCSIPRTYETPIITLLFQGEVSDIHLVLGLIRNRLPVVVVEGSGGLADILAFAYHHITCRPDNSNIAEFLEIVLKPLLCQKINQFYPNMSKFNLSERNFCEKIFDCFRHFKQQEQIFLTILTLRDLEDEFMPLTSHLLRSLFKSVETEKIKDSFQIKNDLFLAMDWNSPNVASRNIFAKDPTSKFHIDNETFFRALTKPQREQFVSIFLSRGFVLHRFLDSKALLQLFQDSLSREFFRNVIWESVLGYGSTTELSRHFIDNKLVLLLEDLTGIPSLINTYELDWYSRRIYDNRTPEQAERKAVAVLTLWALLSYRVNLVKILWKVSEQPVHLALISSMILRNLAPYVSDLSLKNEMEKQSEEFSVIATNVITKCYETLPARALDLLCERNPIWCYKPLIEIAAFAKDRKFIANSCSQKYLDNMFMGKIKVRDLPYGDVTIPLWMKIILTNLLIFPMYLWIDFDTDNGQQSKVLPLKNQSISSVNKGSTSNKSMSSYKIKPKQLSFRQKLYFLYTAPISKFWISQVFYLIFLFFFSLAVIWPACGSLYLDFITCLWTSVIIMDSIYQVIILGKKYSSMSLVYKSAEIIFMSIFLFCYVLSRILWFPSFMSPYGTKVMLCIALLYFYYRVIFIAYPISPALGPMLRRIKRMTLVDFTGFMRVTALIVISNGIVIHATIYPDYPLNRELVRRTFFDAMIAFFLTPADHFGEPDPRCILLPRNPNKKGFLGIPENVCKVGRYYLPECPNPGFWPYIFGLQYFLFLKLVLLTILIALFSNTEMKMGALGTYIWKYQRYELVVTFTNRLAFPSPFSPISYCIMLFEYVRNFFRPKKFQKEDELLLDENDYVYWKGLASEYDMKINEENDQDDKTKDHMVQICSLTDALRHQKESITDLESMLLKLQIQVKNAQKYLTSSMMQVSLKERLLARNVPQIFSRISPYPFTNISRFPVSDNHVTWDRSWKSYDPIAYNMPKEDFPPELRSFVDIDIQMKREIEGEDFQMPVFMWNKTSMSPAGMSLDRKSWIVGKFGKPFEYELDAEGLPVNPFGRTGLRGRGALPRWGPNHYTFVVITRWHEMEMASYRNYLDAVLYLPNSDVTLPGGYVSTENTYFIIQSLFHCGNRWNSETDMINFFELLSKEAEESSNPEPEVSMPSSSRGSLAILDNLRRSSLARVKRLISREQGSVSNENEKKSHDAMDQHPFISDCIKRGYLDEDTNTDQAWSEAEVWHFHYNGFNSVEEKFKATMLWLVLTDDILEKVPPGQAAVLYSVAKKMKAVLEVT